MRSTQSTNNKSKSQPIKTTNKVVYNVSTPNTYQDNEGVEKTFWTSIGRAFQTDKGIMIKLNALPLTDKIYLQEHVPSDNQVQQ